MNVLIYIFISGVLAVAGQLILKRALLAMGPLAIAPDNLVDVVLGLALNPLIILGLAVTVSGTFFWLIVLSRVDLGFAYPFASLNYIVILGASWVLLGESVSPVRLVGVVAICLGVCLVARTPRHSTAARRSLAAQTGAAPTAAPIAPGVAGTIAASTLAARTIAGRPS